MKSKFFSLRAIICFMSLWKFSYSAKLDSTPATFLKPMMLFNRAVLSSVYSRPDNVCTMTLTGKKNLCELVFNENDLKARYKIQYDGRSKKKPHCEEKTFKCILNSIFTWRLTQEMLVCPVVSSESGKPVDRYYVSTNYSADKIILFEAGADGRVSALVSVYDLDLEKLHKEDEKLQKENDKLQKQDDKLQKQDDKLQKQDDKLQKQDDKLQKEDDELQKEDDELQKEDDKKEDNGFWFF